MKVNRILALDQNSDQAEELAIKNNTSKSICGYVTCAMCQYLAQQDHVDEQLFKSINFNVLKPYIDKAMQSIAKTRKMEIKKFMSKMNESQRKSYLTDWVANF